MRRILELILNHGLYIFPLNGIRDGICSCSRGTACTSPGKHPLYHHDWRIVAKNKESVVRGWFNKTNVINIGLATGRKANNNKYLVVVDIDQTEHELLSTLRPTFGYKTGGGGYHLWYFSEYPVANSVSLIADKVDIRGTNGYVVIPPSKHISGSEYTILDNGCNEISDLPMLLADMLRTSVVSKGSKTKKKISLSFNKKSVASFSLKTLTWSKIPVPVIQKTLASGGIIPVGIRNATCHRLLSSERAKGANRNELIEVSKKIILCMEDSESFKEKELSQIIESVMKYPAYNNQHENVNSNFIKFLKNRKIDIDANFEFELTEADNAWFNSLEKGPGVSFDTLLDNRTQFLSSFDFKYISQYKAGLMSKKLKELGFTRKRTTKCNLWEISVNFDKLSCYYEIMKTKIKSNKPIAETKPTRKVNKVEEKVVETKATMPIEPVVDKQIVTIKRKEHPNMWRYPNSTNTEYLGNLMRYMSSLTKEEKSLLRDNDYMRTPEETIELFNEIEIGDVIGCETNLYKIVSKTDNSLIGCMTDGKKAVVETRTEIPVSQLDFAKQIGYAEILIHNDKFYGVSDTEEVTLIIKKYIPEDKKSEVINEK